MYQGAMAYMMRYFLAFYSLALLAPDSLLHAKSQEFDVLVYGATPAGVCAAVAASREGASVALVSPYDYVGGMISGGLSLSDGNQCARQLMGGLFDEVHERSLDSDFGLALALEAQGVFRPDLRLIAMSATLDGARFSALMHGCPVIESEGRSHPLELVHIGRRAERRIEDELAGAVQRALAEREGETRDSMSTPIAQWDSILLSDLGTPDQRVVSGHLEDIAKAEGGRIHCLILPAEFSGLEREAYERRKGQR